jgi:hypothetical protein
MQCLSTDFQKLAARVEKLEASNRRWKLTSALLSLFGVAFLLMGAKPADSFDKQVIRPAQSRRRSSSSKMKMATCMLG